MQTHRANELKERTVFALSLRYTAYQHDIDVMTLRFTMKGHLRNNAQSIIR